MQKAAVTLESLLGSSVRLRLRHVKEVAVAFSGGLDSSVIAFLAKKCGLNVHLIHVSLRDHPETAEAKKAAEAMKLPINVHLFEEEDVKLKYSEFQHPVYNQLWGDFIPNLSVIDFIFNAGGSNFELFCKKL